MNNIRYSSKGQGAVIASRHIKEMLHNIKDYELVKSKKHSYFSTLNEFYVEKGICRQNFLKYYRRFLNANRNIEELIPKKIGRKFNNRTDKEYEDLKNKVIDYRQKAYNRHEITYNLFKYHDINISASTTYRLLCRLNMNKINPKVKQKEITRIVKMSVGELGHIDAHYLTKNIIKDKKYANKKLYLLGIIDDYSRLCWVKVIDSLKAVNVTFEAMDLIMRLKSQYNIQFQEMMSDNGSEFASRNNPDHPFERMLTFYDIKHRYTKPYRPQTNGKIERFWKTIEDELLRDEQFDSLKDLEEYILSYNLHYNEQRLHQGINNKRPIDML